MTAARNASTSTSRALSWLAVNRSRSQLRSAARVPSRLRRILMAYDNASSQLSAIAFLHSPADAGHVRFFDRMPTEWQDVQSICLVYHAY